MVAGHVAVWLSLELRVSHVHLVSRSGALPKVLVEALGEAARLCDQAERQAHGGALADRQEGLVPRGQMEGHDAGVVAYADVQQRRLFQSKLLLSTTFTASKLDVGSLEGIATFSVNRVTTLASHDNALPSGPLLGLMHAAGSLQVCLCAGFCSAKFTVPAQKCASL